MVVLDSFPYILVLLLCAYDNGGTAWVHTWGSATVQDFQGGLNGTLNIQTSTYGTCQINNVHGMWSFYLAHGGIGSFGPAKNDEYPGL